MALRHELTIFVCVFAVLGYNVEASRSDNEIEILSKFETIIEANDNFTVFCQGKKPLKWTVPHVPKDKESWTTFQSTFEKPVVREFQYGIRLTIINMTYPFVGFYYCHHEDADKKSETESPRIYLYVNDYEHLSILEGGNTVETVIVTQFQEAIIPCKPTSPDVHVNLNSLAGEEVEDTSYDPKTGYKFYVSDLSQQQIYICTFSRNAESDDIFVHLTIDSSLPVSYLPKPDIKDKSGGHTVVGEPLMLDCTIKTSNTITFQWTPPNKGFDDTRMNTSVQMKIGSDRVLQTLTIYNTTIEDNGRYYCNVSDTQSHRSFAYTDVKIYSEEKHIEVGRSSQNKNICNFYFPDAMPMINLKQTILTYDTIPCSLSRTSFQSDDLILFAGVNEYYLNMSEPNDVYSLIASAGQSSVQWSLDVKGHPKPTVTWLNNKNETIPLGNGNKYETNFTLHTAFLKIKNIAITDFGNYTLLASNNKTEKSLSLFLNVTDKPSVRIESEPFHLIDTPSIVKCYAYAYPEPEFEWYHKNCQTGSCRYLPINGTTSKSEGFEFISEVTINASESGYIRCRARNYKGFDQAISGFYISDIKNGFDLYGLDSTIDVNEEARTATVARDDPITIICGASIYNYTDINWFHNDQIIKNDEKHKLTKSSTKYSKKLQLEISNANYTDDGLYSCRITGKNGDYLYKNMSFYIAEPVTPKISKSNMTDELEMALPEVLVMYCEVFGIPKPTVSWYKDGVLFNPLEPSRIQVDSNNQKVTFFHTDAKDEGTYMCEARNRVGAANRTQAVRFTNLPRGQKWFIFIIIFLSILFIGAIVFIAIKLRKEKQLQRELKKLGLANFEKGAVENINPELGIDDQAELLPYDQKWEFPIEHLKLGKQLGSGAFGVVMKGEAKHIVEDEDLSTVAVKMVKKNADNTYIRALASELKIMVHLGKHLNVVNLLGACTKNVAKRELLVIVEYCRFGNLQNYLLRHRDNYIDQVDPKTGKIDYLIGQELFDRTYSVSSDRSSNHPILPPANNMGDYRANANSGTSANTEMTNVAQEEGMVLSNNSVQPEWRSNYKGDYKGNVKPICTKDLLAWAFQVARGMEYLASRKVLHGDLAARNILLADNNVVKICDFGLAKSMYKNDNYKKRGDGPLPVKWMAIESIRDRVFSTQSDVWSFGIVLWEFFSLARTPYPGMEADERLYHKLVDGYRMESPDYAPKAIYKMMTDCWAPKPLTRPSFTKLTETIGNLLEDSLRKHYIDLNDPYLVMNTQRLEDGKSDYLSMVSPPTFEALCTPHYVNESVGQAPPEDSGYLSMKPSTIFSPRVDEGGVFDFNVSNRKHLTSVDGNGPELLPMLRRQSESDCDTPAPSPASATDGTSYSNPSYHIPPKITEETGETTNNNTDIVKSSDNYVNMPQNKSIIKDKNNPVNNPFVNVNSGNGDVHYVNSNSKDWESITV